MMQASSAPLFSLRPELWVINYPQCSTAIGIFRIRATVDSLSFLSFDPPSPLSKVEAPYQRLLGAPSPDAAGVEWAAFRRGLRYLDTFLATNGSVEGPYFLGREPSLAEAATAPSIFRMVATLVRGQRGLGILHIYTYPCI